MRKRIAAVSAFFLTSGAFADYYDMYRADYIKGAFCSAIAGACASDDDPENSFFQNPAALTPPGKEPDFVYDGDYDPSGNIEPGMKTSNDVAESTYVGGVGYSGEKWGIGAALQGRQDQVDAITTVTDAQKHQQFLNTSDSSTTLYLNIPFSYRLNEWITLGVSLYFTYYKETLTIDGAPPTNTSSVDSFPTLGYTLGALARPYDWLRVGSWFRSANTFWVNQNFILSRPGGTLQTDEVIGLHHPWIWASGISIMPWNDKRTLLFDLDLIGTTEGGFERTLDTLQATSDDSSQRAKGRKLALEPHLAWRSPLPILVDGLTYYTGTYYENGRWDGISGRIHGTLGLSYLVKQVPVMGDLETIATIDAAKDYFALLLSFR